MTESPHLPVVKNVLSHQPYLVAIGYALTAAIGVGALVAHSGRSLREPPVDRSGRFCDGNCICDGGSRDFEKIERVCPVGASEVLRKSLRKEHKKQRRKKRMQNEASGGPPSV